VKEFIELYKGIKNMPLSELGKYKILFRGLIITENTVTRKMAKNY
jgi:hypothetical protein